MSGCRTVLFIDEENWGGAEGRVQEILISGRVPTAKGKLLFAIWGINSALKFHCLIIFTLFPRTQNTEQVGGSRRRRRFCNYPHGKRSRSFCFPFRLRLLGIKLIFHLRHRHGSLPSCWRSIQKSSSAEREDVTQQKSCRSTGTEIVVSLLGILMPLIQLRLPINLTLITLII